MKCATKIQFLKRRRSQLCYTLECVAYSMGMSTATIYAIEAGKRNIPRKKIKALMKALEVDDKFENFLKFPDKLLKSNTVSVGDYLKYKRLEQGYTLKELKKVTGVSISTISSMEQNARTFTKSNYEKMGKYIGLDEDDFKNLYRTNAFYLVYRMDEEYRVPIIKKFFVSELNAVKCQNELLRSDRDVVWKIKEYEVEKRVL